MPDPSLKPPRPGAPGGPSREPGSPETADDRLQDDLGEARSTRDPGLLDAALRVVTSLASAAVKGADGVSITLERHGEMTTVAATDETVRRMDDHQYAAGEGPCLAAAAEGRWFHSESLSDEERWPEFIPQAMHEGVASILSTPLLISTRSVGALNIYSRTPGSFGPADREIAARYAARAADVLGEVAVLDDRHGLRITAALTARELIAMAQGVHMARLRVSPDAAAEELYRAARDKGVTVRAEAVAVLETTRPTGGGREVDRG